MEGETGKEVRKREWGLREEEIHGDGQRGVCKIMNYRDGREIVEAKEGVSSGGVGVERKTKRRKRRV